MKTFFEEPSIRVVLFDVRDVLTTSPSQDEDELPFIPKT